MKIKLTLTTAFFFLSIIINTISHFSYKVSNSPLSEGCPQDGVFAQNIGMNGTGANAHPSALVDIDASPSNNTGLLIPRIPLQAINLAAPVTSPATSLLVYNTASASTGTNAVSAGYYYWDGAKWVRFAYNPSGTSTTAWNLLGNAGTNPSTNFIGTTDNQDLVFRTNNTERMRILSNGNVGIGTTNPLLIFEVQGIAPNPQVLIGTTNPASNRGSVLFGRSAFWEVGSDVLVNNSDNFFISQSSSGQYALTINNNRNVGIGTTSPTEKLEVQGSVKIVDGTQGAGKVLVSDASGKGSWQGIGDVIYGNALPTSPFPVNINGAWLYTGVNIVIPPGTWLVSHWVRIQSITAFNNGYLIASFSTTSGVYTQATYQAAVETNPAHNTTASNHVTSPYVNSTGSNQTLYLMVNLGTNTPFDPNAEIFNSGNIAGYAIRIK